MKTINRHNYEEFFLLYVDEELPAAQRREVELFIELNPDLSDELNMLLETRLRPEPDLLYADKSSLFRTGAADINADNYEEYFLLYIDQELDIAEKESVEKFILQHPQLQDQFTLLQQTVLPAEPISFTDKSVLYRREKDERRIVWLSWQRLAVAAAITGFALMAWWLIPGTDEQLASASLPVKPAPSKLSQPNSAVLQPVVQQPVLPNTVTVAIPVNRKDRQVGNDEPRQVKTPVQTQLNDVAVTPVQLPVQQQKTPEETTVLNEKLTAKTTVVAAEKIPVAGLRPLEEIPEENTKRTNAVFVSSDVNATVKPAVYRELDTEEDTKGVYLGSLEINKNKLKGFFKKASRILGIKTKEASANTDNAPVNNEDSNTKKIR